MKERLFVESIDGDAHALHVKHWLRAARARLVVEAAAGVRSLGGAGGHQNFHLIVPFELSIRFKLKTSTASFNKSDSRPSFLMSG
jgi:hypothetical protein